MYINVGTKTIKYVQSLVERVKDHDVSGMAAQLAFFFLLSLFPILLFLVTLLPYLPLTTIDILSFMETFVPEKSMVLIENQIDNLMVGNAKLLSVGVIGTLWSASNGMNALIKAFNRAYDIEENRTYIWRRIFSIVLTLAMVFVFIIALLLPVFGQQLTTFLFNNTGFDEEFMHMLATIRWVGSGLITFFVFSVLYWIFPMVKLHGRKVIRGAFFATVGMTVFSFGFSYYVNNFSTYTSTYGSIGGVIILMLWFYLSAHIIILGGEINAMSLKSAND